MKLGEIADVVRSKNAGIHYVTIDVMFEDAADYEAVRDADVLDETVFADRYGLNEDEVRFFTYDPGQAFKITIPKGHSTGSPGDRDLYGAQQHAPVLDIEIPVET
ncbi:MAG: DUF4387 domain-containing protein [Halapricum sp.]